MIRKLGCGTEGKIHVLALIACILRVTASQSHVEVDAVSLPNWRRGRIRILPPSMYIKLLAEEPLDAPQSFAYAILSA
jgi:hypothetical protein